MKRQRQLLVIVLSGLIVYLNSLRNGFVWDDILTVVNNDFIKGWALLGEAFSKPLYYLTNPEYLYYRPLLGLSFIFDYTIWGLRPFGFHLTNILLHLCAALLVYKLIELFLKDEAVAFCSALLFVLHPVNANVVNNITSRSNILLAIFSLSSLLLFLKARGLKGYILSLFCFAGALLSKETAVIFPLFLIFASEMRSRINKETLPRSARLWYAAFLASPAAFLLFRVKALGIAFNLSNQAAAGPVTILATFSGIILNYLKTIFFPFGLHLMRNIPITQGNPAIVVLALVLCAGAAIIVYKLDKKAFFLCGIFFIWLFPVSLIALKNPEFSFQQRAIIEHHWLYLPAIGAFTLLFYLLKKFLPGRFYNYALIAFAVFLAAITVKENTYWRNNKVLFGRTLEYVKNSPTVYRNLAWIAVSKDDAPSAVKLYKEALEIKQSDRSKASLYRDLGYAYLLDKDAQKAGEALQEGIKLNPDNAGLRGLMGLLYSGNEPGKAKEEWQLALERDPFEPMAFNGMLIESRSKKELNLSLIIKYRKMLKAESSFDTYKVYRSLGLLYLYSDLDTEAMVHLKRALRIDPYDVKANNALAICYVKRGNTRMAESTFRRSLRLNPFDREVYGNLALFYKEMGKDNLSRAMMRKASSVNIFD